MAVGKEDVLAFVVRLPFFPRQAIGSAADTVLGIIILVGASFRA